MKLSFGLKAKPRAKPQLFQGSDDDEEETGPANKRQRVEASPGLLHIWLLLPFRPVATLWLTCTMRLGVQSSARSQPHPVIRRCIRWLRS